MRKIFLFIAPIIMFTGCMSTKGENIVYEEYKKPNIVQKKQKIVTKKYIVQKVAISGTIKGIVKEIFYNGDNWEYFIESIDLQNEKLPQARFSHKTRVAKKGDKVYAIIKNGKLKEYFLIKKENSKQVKVKKVRKEKLVSHKRTKKRQLLGVPSSESISLY